MGTIGRKKLLARKQNPRGPSLGTLLSTLSKRLKKKKNKGEPEKCTERAQ